MLSFQKTDRNLRGGRLVKYKGRAESCAPTMLLASVSALALSFGLAHADVISTPQTTPQALGAGVHVWVAGIPQRAQGWGAGVWGVWVWARAWVQVVARQALRAGWRSLRSVVRPGSKLCELVVSCENHG